MKTTELIEMTAKRTARQIVTEMQRKDMIRENRLGSFKKTERVLFEYPEWKLNDDKETRKFCRLIEKALERVKPDPYFDIIPLKYWQGWTHEAIAEHFGVDVSVISKRRTKLINQLRPVIFSADFIRELFDM